MRIFNAGARSILWRSAIFCVAILLLTQPASAVFVRAGNGNTSAPVDDPGFANVGRSTTGNASVVYIGNGWVISAFHVAFAIGNSVQFNGSPYVIGSVPAATGAFSANGQVTGTDLRMFRLSTSNPFPALPSLQIASSSPTNGSTNVTMIGNGLGHPTSTPTLRGWVVNVSPDPAVDHWYENPTETLSSPNAYGFSANANRNIRWGNDQVDFSGFASGVGNYYGTTLNNYNLNVNEAQVTNGDSGGGSFFKQGAQWYLSGIIYAEGTYNLAPNQTTPTNDPQRFSVAGDTSTYGQPDRTAVYGNESYVIDLRYYRSTILATIPEPSTSTLLLLGILGAARMSSRARRRRNAAS